MTYRTVRPDNTIVMPEPFEDPAIVVQLRRPNRAPVSVSGAALNTARATQRGEYQAEARRGNDDQLYGPTGLPRPSNELRNVDVTDLLGGPSDQPPAS